MHRQKTTELVMAVGAICAMAALVSLVQNDALVMLKRFHPRQLVQRYIGSVPNGQSTIPARSPIATAAMKLPPAATVRAVPDTNPGT